MIVYEFNGKKECNNLIELQEVLKHRSKGNSNEFELRTELEYPFLTILIKEELACVHYFKDENDCARLEFEEIKKYFERGYIPLIYKEDDLSFEELEKYNPLKVEPLKGMIEHQEIFTEIDDVNKINPYYLKGHGRE